MVAFPDYDALAVRLAMIEAHVESMTEDRDGFLAIAEQRKKRIAELEAQFSEAIEDMELWAANTPQDFRYKYDLAGRIAQHRAALKR